MQLIKMNSFSVQSSDFLCAPRFFNSYWTVVNSKTLAETMRPETNSNVARFLFLCAALPGIGSFGCWSRDGVGVASARPIFGVRRTRTSCGAVDRRSLASAESKINRYLKEDGDSAAAGEFYIQGWRWHTMSLAREAGRLEKLAQRIHARLPATTAAETESLKKAADYVVDFNMKGLHKIERDIFFPWVRWKVGSSLKGTEVPSAFDTLMDRLDSDRRKIEGLGKSLVSSNLSASASCDGEFSSFVSSILFRLLYSSEPGGENRF